jgi:HEAT repeat protein
MFRRIIVGLSFALLLAASSPLHAQDGADSTLSDELKLKSAGLGTDGEGLVTFFRLRAKGEVSAKKLNELLDKLENKSALVRQKACGELVAIGPPAIPLLRQAVRDADNPDVVALARRCLKALQTDSASLTAAAVRLLAKRKAQGAAEVLLDYLPHAENDAVLEEARNALVVVAYIKGKAESAVLKALDDEHPLRRASAIMALCSSGIAEPRAKLRKLLVDPMPSVRLRASLALAQASDAKAVSTLIALLGELPEAQAREVEGALSDLAGDKIPSGTTFGSDKASREKARDAWAKWWLDTEGPGLLEELKKRTLTEDLHNKAVSLIDKMADDDFDTREEAEAALRKMGPIIISLIKGTDKHKELEVRKRGRKILEAMEKIRPPALSPVTARLIALRKPKGAAQALLGFVPFAEDDSLLEEIQLALNAVAYPGGKPNPLLVKALSDKTPDRRAAAAAALANGPMGLLLKSVSKLLHDKQPSVRLKVGLALAYAHEPAAVPVLIKLVGTLPPEQSIVAEEYLTKLAREELPKGLPEGDGARKKRSDLWMKWYDARKSSLVLVDRNAPQVRERYFGYTLLVMPNNGKVCELDAKNKERWSITGMNNPYDAQVLRGGKRILIAEYNAQRVTERDLKGTVKWEKNVGNWPLQAQRLRNGNTFVVCRNMLVEYDRSGKEVVKIDRPHDVYTARKLPNGQIVVITQNRTVQRLDRKGKELKSFSIPMVFYNSNHIMDNGNVLIPLGWQNVLIEYNAKGKEVKRFTVAQPIHAFRLPNGNTLVSSQQWPYKVLELDKKGKQLGEVPTGGAYVIRAKRR